MKIDINNEIISAGHIKTSNTNTLKNPGYSQTSNAGSQSSKELQNTANKRAYIDAIILSQMARNLFQSAILISSRLKNIANEAILSGSIDNNKLKETLSEINLSLNKLQETEKPVSTALQEHITAFNFYARKIGLTEENNNLNVLTNVASDLSAGKQPDLKKIDRINDNFINKISNIDNFVNSFSAEFAIPEIRNTNADALKDLSNRTKSLVSDYPQAALNTQGNISHEAVANLTQD